jgi:hypothetical protein
MTEAGTPASRVRMHLEHSVVAREDLLLERDRELGLLGWLLSEAAAGRAHLAVIEGPAGIGKTRLVSEARRNAVDTGFKVLAAQGALLEPDFPFGVVRQLFEADVVKEGAQAWRGQPSLPARFLSRSAVGSQPRPSLSLRFRPCIACIG